MIGTHLIVPGQSNAFALVNSGGASVYLGGSDDDRPPGLSTTVQAALGLGNMSTTYMHDARLTGMMSAKGFAMRGFTIPDLVRGATDNVDIGSASVIRVWSTAPGSTITGFTGGVDGRVLVVVNRGSDLTLAHENGGSLDRNRITTSTGDDITTIGAGTATLWYDASYGRWIVVSFIP
jgi:hypothetical protein